MTTKKKLFGWLGAIGGAVAAAVIAAQPHHGGGGSGPTTPPAVPTYTLIVHVCRGDCAKDDKIVGADVALNDAAKTTTDAAGNAEIASLAAGHYIVCAEAQGRKRGCHELNLPADGGEVFLALEADVPPIVPLHVDGSAVFRAPDGSAWRWKFVTAFRAAQRWAAGEDLEPFVQWTRDVGANGWRVILQFNGGPNTIGIDGRALRPADLPADKVAAFADWCAARGLYVELTVLADSDALGMGSAAQRSRVKGVVEAVAGKPNVLVEISNEPFAGKGNSDNPADIARALGYDRSRPVLMATGDYDIIANPQLLVLDYLTDHPGRKPDWPGEAGKVGHFVFDGWDPDAQSPGGWRGFHGPLIEDEPIGAQEAPNPNLGRRDNRVEAFEDGGGGFGMGNAGATFHCDDCLQTVVPGPVQTACAKAFFAAMDFFAGDAPTGKYAHDGFPNQPLASIAGKPADQGAVEVAARVFTDRAYVVAAQPGSNYKPVPQGGWRIVRTNARGNVLELAR